MRSQVVPLSREELLGLPAVVDISTAARALGIGKTKALSLARAGEFPVPILRFGRALRVSTADLLRLLNVTTESP